MIGDLLFRQINELRRNLSAIELSVAEINNSIYLLEERMYDIEDFKEMAKLDELEVRYGSERF